MEVSGDDLKELICKTEEKIQQIYGKMLKEVKVFQENELQAYKNYSKEELAKVETKFKEYSIRMKDILGELLERLQYLKNGLETKIISHKEFQNLVTYFEEKIAETKKLTQETINHINETLRNPELQRKLVGIVETNYKKVKGAMDALHTAVRKNVQFKSSPDKKSFFSKISTFGKMKTSIECSTTQTFSKNGNGADTADCKGNSAVGLIKEKLPFFNLSKHFNSKTIYGRANVAKATYAGILIYYIYRKAKSTNS